MMAGMQQGQGHPAQHAAARSLFEGVQVCLARPGTLAERCRELTRVLVTGSRGVHAAFGGGHSGIWSAPLKEAHTVFNMLMGEVFGYPAGGTANGWNICTIALSKQGNNRDFYAALQFLNSGGPMMSLVERLMSGASSNESQTLFTEFPATQLPVSSPRHSPVLLSPFEFFFYHFANAPVRHHQLAGGQSPVTGAGDGGNVGDMLYPLLVEDYLNAYLPLDKAQMVKMFTSTQSSVASSPLSSPSPQMSPLSHSARVKATLLRPDFANRLDSGSGFADQSPIQTIRTNIASSTMIHTAGVAPSETWRSQILVRILVMFWMESYVNDYQGGGGGAGGDLDYLRTSASLPPPELFRVIRMFIKHAHYFTNACKNANDVVIPMSFNPDVFGDANHSGDPGALRRTLLAFTHRSIDHWPLDGSFRLVLETWLSYIQPWRYLNPNARAAEDLQVPVDEVLWRQFVSDNYMFYSAILVKVLNRFFRVDLVSTKNAYMLYRVARVISQENLLTIVKNVAHLQHKGSPQTQKMAFGAQLTDDIFSTEFRSILANLLCSAMDAKYAKLSECRLNESRNKAREEEKGAKSKDFLSQVVAFIATTVKGSDNSASQMSSDNAEVEKALGHLDFVADKLGPLFGVSDVVGAASRRLAQQAAAKDRVDGSHGGGDGKTPGDGGSESLSPAQRRDILMRRVKVETKWYDGNPDTTPVRSDESPYLVKLTLFVSQLINNRYQDEIEDVYYRRTGLLSDMFRQLCTPPVVCRRGVVPEVSSVSSFSEDSDFEITNIASSGKSRKQKKVRLPPRIVLRPLASYRLLFYLSLFYLMAVLIFGKSFGSATFYIGLFFTLVVAFKAFISPSDPVEVDLTLHATNLRLEGH